MTCVSRPVGGGSRCCDCSVNHAICGCGCIPEVLCSVVRFTAPDCCGYSQGLMFHNCGTDSYGGMSAYCDGVAIGVSATVTKVDGVCCFTVTMNSGFEQVTFSNCGADFAVGLTGGFSLITSDSYPPTVAEGTITIGALGGVSNPKQFGDIAAGECPDCPPFKMTPRGDDPDPPITPCNRPSIYVATKTAERTLDLTDPLIFDNELCWYLPPCNCIPSTVCLTYYVGTLCFPSAVYRLPMAFDGVASFEEVTITVDRGCYGDETITVSGAINRSCEIVWTVTTNSGTFIYTKSMQRYEPEIHEFAKRCDVTAGSQGSPITVTGSDDCSPTPDSFYIDERCICEDPADLDCAPSCAALRLPDSAIDPSCVPPILYADIMSDCVTTSFGMEHLQFSRGGGPTSGSLTYPNVGECQKYISSVEVDPIGAPGTYSPEFPVICSNGRTISLQFQLYYLPPDCDEVGEEPNPDHYYLIWRYVSFIVVAEGTTQVEPSGSCKDFTLDFNVPAPGDIHAFCACGDPTMLVRITL